MSTGNPANKNEPPLNSLYWNLWKMGPTPLNQIINTQFYKNLQGNNYDANAVYVYNMNDFFWVDALQGLMETAATMEGKTPHPSIQFALYYLNSKLNERINGYETVWNLQRGMWAPTDVYVKYAHFLFNTLLNDGVFYFMCAALARLTLWGILPNTINPTNPDYAKWVQWKNSQELSYVIGNQMDYYSNDNPGSYDIHKALSIYGDSLNYEVQFTQVIA